MSTKKFVFFHISAKMLPFPPPHGFVSSNCTPGKNICFSFWDSGFLSFPFVKFP